MKIVRYGSNQKLAEPKGSATLATCSSPRYPYCKEIAYCHWAFANN
jgi:hypothetical protein